MQRIPCVLMRGGTSKGPVFLAWDLPVAIAERDELLLNLMGSGHELEIDGIGGGSPQTSKVAIVSPSLHPDADVDYLFVQVMVSQRRVDTAPNCGNMLCAVGPFAIEQGLVKPSGDLTRVRIRNLNTGTFVNSEVQTPEGKVRYEGDTAIDGVPGTAAPVQLTFLDAAGSKTGKLFPTGQPQDLIDGIPVTRIDMAMPMVIVQASQLGKRGDESPAELDADKAFLQRLESLRLKAGLAMGLGDVSDKVIPQTGAGVSGQVWRDGPGALFHATQLSPRPGDHRFHRLGHCVCDRRQRRRTVAWHRQRAALATGSD